MTYSAQVTDWPAIIRAIRLTGMTVQEICDAMHDMGREVCIDYIYKLAYAKKRNPHFETGDALLRLLEERDPKKYEQLYVQTRQDRRKEWAA